MKRAALVFLAILISYPVLSADITFSGGTSSLSLQDSQRYVNLGGGASVTVDSLSISADSITLEGDDYEAITCTGNVLIEDSERGLSIRTSRLFYDRIDERLIISSWCEISDRENELVATASALHYDMDNEVLELEMNVNLAKNTSDGVLSARSQSVVYDRTASTLVLSGGSTVDWKSDSYSASVITIDLDSERINLSGQIGGTIHG